MANELQEYLAGLGLRDEAIEKAMELAVPETFRKDLAEMGGELKTLRVEAKEFQALKKAPARAKAFKERGVDVATLSKAEKATLERFDWEGDEPSPEAVAAFISEWELPVTQTPKEPDTTPPPAAQIVAQGVEAAPSVPVPTTDTDFYRDLEAVPDGDKEAVKAVLAKHGRGSTS